MVTKTKERLDRAADIANRLSEINLKFSDTELNLRLAELLSCLNDVQREFDAMRHNVDVKEVRITQLERQLAVVGTLDRRGPFYYRKTASGREGPYCRHCWDDKKQLVHLKPAATKGTWYCPSCGQVYQSEASKVSQMRLIKDAPPMPRHWTPY